MDNYFTIETTSIAEFKDRGSKFIGTVFQIENAVDFKLKLNAIKKEHIKAVHHCFAYRIGLTGDNFRINDDGEPSGSAGKPILGQIDSKKVTNTAIVVTRYFGGTLLGVPGLINAYKTVAALALQTTPIIQKPILIPYELAFDYLYQNDIMRFLKQYNCVILESNINLFSTIKFGIPKRREAEALFKMQEMHNITVKKILC